MKRIILCTLALGLFWFVAAQRVRMRRFGKAFQHLRKAISIPPLLTSPKPSCLTRNTSKLTAGGPMPTFRRATTIRPLLTSPKLSGWTRTRRSLRLASLCLRAEG